MKQLHWIFGVWLWTFSFLGLGLGLIGQETAPKSSAQTAGVESTEIFNPLVDDAVIRLLEAFPDKVLQVAKAEGDNPDTKEVLGEEELEIGKVRMTAVLPMFLKASILEDQGITEGALLSKCLRNVG